jgi:chromosome partitioning protein
LLIDLDPQGNATTASGIKEERPNTLCEPLFNNTKPLDCLYSSPDGYKIIPGSQDLIALDVAIREQEKQGYLRKALSTIEDGFDYTIIDTPPTLNQLTIEALMAASGTLIPLQCEYYSLEGVTGLMETIQTISDNNMANNRVIGIIRTMVDLRNNLAKEVSAELENHFPHLVFNTLIPRNVKLAEAPSHNTSGIKYMPNSYGAKAYLALTGELIRKVENV